MMWTQRFWLKLQSLFRRNRNAKQLNDEIQFHLDQQIAENMDAGMSRDEARYAAMRTFGNPTYLKEETRGTWGQIPSFDLLPWWACDLQVLTGAGCPRISNAAGAVRSGTQLNHESGSVRSSR